MHTNGHPFFFFLCCMSLDLLMNYLGVNFLCILGLWKLCGFDCIHWNPNLVLCIWWIFFPVAAEVYYKQGIILPLLVNFDLVNNIKLKLTKEMFSLPKLLTLWLWWKQRLIFEFYICRTLLWCSHCVYCMCYWIFYKWMWYCCVYNYI
jgi:hypothetical protein